MAKIEVKNLSFAYRDDPDHLIIKDLSASIEEGDFVSVIGQSGCGKSTFLKLLAGLEIPTAGELLIDGKTISGPSMSRSVVFQDYGLFPWMSAGDNIVLALEQRYPDKKKKELREIARIALEQVGLPPTVFNKFPKALSGGMKQRCAIARSFSINPPLLLMDEPFGALDAVTRVYLQKLVLQLWESEEKRKTVIFVTHDVDEAILLSNKIFVLGQSPSNIICTREIDEKDKTAPDALYRNEHIIQIRNELVEHINRDVFERLEKKGIPDDAMQE